MSPAAAWIAIAGSLDARMLILCAAVTLWVGGFDVLYACQDIDTTSRRDSFRAKNASASARAPYHCPRHARRNDRAAAWLAQASLALPAWIGNAVVPRLLPTSFTRSPNDLAG